MKLINYSFKFGGIVRNTVKKFDFFSQRIMFTYKGETSFSTFIGGFISLLILAIIAIYSGYLVQVIVSRQNSNNSLSTEVVDLTVKDENYYPASFQIKF